MTGNPFGEVPALPVVIPLGVALFAGLVFRLRADRIISIPRVTVSAMLAIYAAGIVANTIFPIFLHKPASGEPWTAGVALVPFRQYELTDAVINVAVFVPLGALIGLVLIRPSWWRVMLAVLGTSLGIELTQLATQRLFSGGHVADINDLLSNVMGGAAGYVLLRVLSSVPVLARLIERMRWTSRRHLVTPGR